MDYVLRNLLNNREIISIAYRQDYEVKVWAGLKHPFARALTAQRCYEPTGLFKDIIWEQSIPRVVSAVIKNKRILAWAMLVSESVNMTYFKVNTKRYNPIGFIGYYMVLKFRQQGLATLALKELDQTVISLLINEKISKYCYFGQVNVRKHQDRVCRIKVLPFSRLEDLDEDVLILQ
jgi:hypothetical protein